MNSGPGCPTLSGISSRIIRTVTTLEMLAIETGALEDAATASNPATPTAPAPADGHATADTVATGPSGVISRTVGATAQSGQSSVAAA